ncbi:carbonate dehydratase [Hymenobacter sp. DG25B]|jgi:carbonic anhydrase|uniref:carbonic anhydrase n=1 Tax=Hymenobacter sp. DG25B TaxID=1385664 RepID=UPI0005410B60|nr:carbonic anhydrase [Hymenobacter sp. DG25B]AIZ62612.1 carbonate dehydratase [Hymenobacter sp. DG25B]
MTTYEQLFENNRQWVAQKLSQDPDFFLKLSREQRPDYLFIGCSDSRVPANEIMGLDAGEVFVHRNIANVVSNTDLNVLSVINYAVEHLQVKRIIVCGHYQCGGVRAAMESKDLGILNPWLRNIRDVYRLHAPELNQIPDDTARYQRLAELNVLEQCINVIKTAEVQQSYLEKGYPEVEGWIFDLHNGQLIDLKIDFKARLQQIQQIYNLTGQPHH